METLKYARLARIENLPTKEREAIAKETGKRSGLAIIQTTNPDLQNKVILITDFCEYLRSLGKFTDAKIADEES